MILPSAYPARIRRVWMLRGGALAVVAAVAGGCHQHERSEFGDDDPATRIAAIREAAIQRDAAQLPELIESLYSDDGAERFLAIRTLEELTGRTLGYDHAAPPAARREAADRWADWYHAHQGDSAASRPVGRDAGDLESVTNP